MNSWLVVEPTHLENMQTSNWIISPILGVKIKKNELPPSSFSNLAALGSGNSNEKPSFATGILRGIDPNHL